MAATLVPMPPVGTVAAVAGPEALGPRLDLVAAQTAPADPPGVSEAAEPAAAHSLVDPASAAAAPVAVRGATAGPSTQTAVRASWFGPGLWGNRTACGKTLTADLEGVAHRTLPCGSVVTLSYRGATVTVPVVDRGPFVAGREFDLTYATRLAIGCPDLCRLAWLR